MFNLNITVDEQARELSPDILRLGDVKVGYKKSRTDSDLSGYTTSGADSSPPSLTSSPQNKMAKVAAAQSDVHYEPDYSKEQAIEILEAAYRDKISLDERFFLNELEEKWAKEKPLKDKRILINAHMTLITLAQIRLFIVAGAEVETTAALELVTHIDALSAIKEAHIIFYADGEIEPAKQKKYYDLVYDCGAGMLWVDPKAEIKEPYIVPRENGGHIELTHTHTELYQEVQFPVVTVDKSRTKELETAYGTGESAVRVLKKQAEVIYAQSLQSFVSPVGTEVFKDEAQRRSYMISLAKWEERTRVSKDETYVIFGFGKVGKGIAYALVNKAGVVPKNIYIVEVNKKVDKEIIGSGFRYLPLILTNAESTKKSKIKIVDILKKTQVVITATGVEGVVSSYFEPEDFSQVLTLMNMGTPDEFGHKFTGKNADKILNNKKPANFMLARPTEVRYLDPIFWIWARAGLEILNGCYQKEWEKARNSTERLLSVSAEIDEEIHNKWNERYGDNVWESSNAPLKMGKSLTSEVVERGAYSKEEVESIFTHYGAFNSDEGLSVSHHSCNGKILRESSFKIS